MKVHTNRFKEEIGSFGRQIDSIITYQLNGVTQTITSENLNGVTPTFQGSILKSVMKQLDVDSNINIPIGTSINYKFGVLVDGKFEYLDFGNYVVYSSEKQEDYNSYKIVCYDKMLYSMKQNEDLGVTYPISVRDYLKALCNKLGIQFKNANDNFVNYSRMIQKELYVGLDYTYRDILDELAQVTASTICLNENDELELRYISNNAVDTIDEEYLKDINVNFGQKYGPINSIVLSRSAESDNVYLQDEESIQANGLCELKIADNQIMNWNDRSDYLPEILAELDGLEYYINDFVSTGIAYLELCDRYNVKIGDNTYSCVMLNDELEVTQGLVENIHTDIPEETETDYTKADKTDRKINNVSIIVDKQQNQIELLAGKIVDISAQASGHKEVELENCSATPLYKLKITGDDSLLFPGDKKKHFTYETYDGSSIDVDIKGSSYDINNLEVKGRSTQETRSGKNLIKLEKGNTGTQNGVTFKVNDDYSITLNGTCNKDNTSFSFNTSVIIPSDGAYTLSSKFVSGSISNTTNFTQIQILRSSDWAGITLKLNNEDDSKTSQISVGKYNACSIRIDNNVVLSNYTIKIQLEEGSTATNWESFGLSPSPDYPSEIESVKGRNICDVSTSQIGVSWVLSTDSARAICNVRVMPNTTYSLSFENINGIDGLFFGEKVKSTDTSVIGGMAQITTNRQITTTSTTNWLCIQFNKANISLNDIEAIKLQIEKGSAITNFVPFDNIQIINTGKNLFDKTTANLGKGVSTSTGNLYNESPLFATDFIEIIPNTNYVVNGYSTSANRVYGACYDSSKNYLTNVTTNANISTFKITNTSAKYIRLTGFISDIDTYQLEKGSTATEYEPYKSQTLNIDLQGNELCSIGDTKDVLGISVTGDTTLNKKIGKRIFNGTESWTLQSINSHDIANFQITLDDYVGGSNILAMCDTFSPQTSLIADTTNEGFHINASKILFIRIKKSRCSTVEEFKTWLSTHNVTVIYELETPETINLSPTKPLYLYDGINHLTNDNNADMVAKMVKSTMFLKTSDLYVNQGQSNEKKYDLKIPALRELNGVKDEYNLEDTKATLTKRIGLNANLEEYILTEPQIIDLGEITIELNEGTNILTMPSFPNNYYEVTYLLKNEYTDVFASQAELHSEINVTSDKIELLSKKKVNNDEIIASINLTPEKAQIDANKISLKGKEIDMTSDNININSTNFKVDKDGNLECTNAKVQGKIESNEGSVGGWIISNGSLNNGKNFVRANGFSNIYTMSDIFILQAYISEQSWAKQTIDSDQDLFNFYDVNHDGVIDIVDLLRMKKMIMGVES